MKLKKISEIGDVFSGGTPSTKVNSFWNGSINWITPKDLSKNSDVYISKGERNISKEGLRNSSAILLPKGTILFSSRAPIGYVAIANSELATNQGFKNLIVNDFNDSLFIYYLLKTNVKYIENHASGTTFKEISASVFKNLEFNIPPLTEQRKISNLLFSLDSKIEKNNQIISTLEEIISTLFQHWFIDFEFPNEKGNPYKSSGGRMIGSELGEIPDGWQVQLLGDLISKISKGTTPTKKDLQENGEKVKFLKVKDMPSSGLINYNNLEEIPKVVHYGKLKRSILTKGDILLSIAGTIGKVNIVTVNTELNTNQAVSFIRFSEKQKEYYYLSLLKSKKYQDMLKEKIVHAVQPNLSLSEIKSLKIISPSSEIIAKFLSNVTIMYEKIIQADFEKNKIQEIRDFLQPKLLSGEIDLSEIEEV